MNGEAAVKIDGRSSVSNEVSNNIVDAPHSEGIDWRLIVAVVAGIVIIGLVMYFFIKRRARK